MFKTAEKTSQNVLWSSTEKTRCNSIFFWCFRMAKQVPDLPLTCSGHTLERDPLALRPQAVCLRTKSKEVFAGHSEVPPSLPGCGVMSRHGTGRWEKVRVVGTATSNHLLLRWWREGSHRYNFFFGYSKMYGVRKVFWAHAVMLYLNAASS